MAPHPVSIGALVEAAYDGRDLQLGEVLVEDAAYTRHFVTYASGDLTISGVMNIPTGAGPFPTLVLNHGYIDPDIYVNGQGMMREQDYLARNGFAVLHTDYRNHAQSSDDPDAELELRLGYTADVINAVLAIKRSGIAQLDPHWVGLFGRSMGGGVTYNALVAQPGLVGAAVVYAPVSSLASENFDRWTRGSADGDAIIAAYGAGTGWRLLGAGVPPAVLRPHHRAGHDPARHRRRELPVRVVAGHARRADRRRRRR